MNNVSDLATEVIGLDALTPLHYAALFAHLLALLLSFHLALRHATCLAPTCSSSIRVLIASHTSDTSKGLFMWTLVSSFLGHLLLFPYYLVTYLHSHPIAYKIIAHFFFFLSFILLNLSGIDRFQRFYLILPKSTSWHLLNLLRLSSICFGIISMIGVAFAYRIPEFKYMIAFHSAWTGSLDCILNMTMISSTLHYSHRREAMADPFVVNNGDAKSNLNASKCDTLEMTGSLEIHPTDSLDCTVEKLQHDSALATAGSVSHIDMSHPSHQSLPRFLEKIQRRCQQDQSKRSQLKFKLICLFSLLLLTDLIILAVYVMAFNILRHVRQELYELTTAIGSLHFWFCISLLQMFRQGLKSFSTTRKEHLSTLPNTQQ